MAKGKWNWFDNAPDGWTHMRTGVQENYILNNPQVRPALAKAMDMTLEELAEAIPEQGSKPKKQEPQSESDEDKITIIEHPLKTPAPVKKVRTRTTSSTPSRYQYEKEEIEEEITDIRQWNESLDGISAERLRSCIIFQLDIKKNKFYRDALTPGFLKRTLKSGQTGAQRIHDDTPLGWTTDPMIESTTNSDGEEIRQIVRAPRNSSEWRTLHSKLFNSRGKANPNVVRWLVKKDCSQCKGKGGYNAKVNPKFQSKTRVNFEEYYHYPCDCVHKNPFQPN